MYSKIFFNKILTKLKDCFEKQNNRAENFYISKGIKKSRCNTITTAF